jgi:uncharacterized protein
VKCPIDTDTDLVMTDRQGIEIDYCPRCRGVWLDRGELDKIIERAAAPAATSAAMPAAAMPAPASPKPRWDDDVRTYDVRRYGDDDSERRPYPKKRRSMLGDLFDF